MVGHTAGDARSQRQFGATLRNWLEPTPPDANKMVSNNLIQLGWGRLIFAHTFESIDQVAELLRNEGDGERDIAFYLRDPHVILATAPQDLFLDPSHTFRLWSERYRQGPRFRGFNVRRLSTDEDAEAANRIFSTHNMVTWDSAFVVENRASRQVTYFVAESEADGEILGTVTGVDHTEVFNDPENGSSLWCLAVDAQASPRGVGEALVRSLVEHYFARGRDFVDLSVMHDNELAIALYEKIGFQRVPVFCIKRKNSINEPLFTSPQPEAKLNPYARIIVDEARRRGITTEILDEEFGLFRLRFGGRSIDCQESLTDLTSSIAFRRCDDKRLTHRVLAAADLRVPDQIAASTTTQHRQFLETHGRIVVKPARGEQGRGVSIDLRTLTAVEDAIEAARHSCDDVILEQYVEGQDIRVIVIDNHVVAAAVRRPPTVVGDGKSNLRQLIEAYNRRRMAATGGESHVPLDNETRRTLSDMDLELETVPPEATVVQVRRTANVHTGGTIHDITAELSDTMRDAAVRAAQALSIPVVGLDFAAPDIDGDQYVIIEANERPGLANHEPQPTAERFVDFLFPQTSSAYDNPEA